MAQVESYYLTPIASSHYMNDPEVVDAYIDVEETPVQRPHVYESLNPATLEIHVQKEEVYDPHPRVTDQEGHPSTTQEGQVPSSPACKKPPCWGRFVIGIGVAILISTSIIAFAIVNPQATEDENTGQAVTTTANGQSPSTVNGIAPMITTVETSIKTTATSTSKRPPPTTATFIMECEAPAGSSVYTGIYDLCWLDAVTLIIIQYTDKQVINVTVNTDNRTCSTRVIDSGYWPWRVSCSPHGEVYVIDDSNDRVVVIDKAGEVKEWRPQEVRVPLNIATNDEFIIIGSYSGSPVSVYDSSGIFLYDLSIGGDQYSLLFTQLTQDGLLLATTGLDGHHLILHDLKNNTSETLFSNGTDDGKFDYPAGVCPSPGPYILVCDYVNNRISVFTRGGVFLHQLQYTGGGVIYPYSISVIPRAGKPSLMAATVYPTNIVRIYSLSP